MGKRKPIEQMSVDELLELGAQFQERRLQRNARRRERRRWLKTAPREETALRYRAEEKPCSVELYLKVERSLLRWIDEFPDLQGNAAAVLLLLAHNILHQLHPDNPCRGTTLVECPTFDLHTLCLTAVDITLNYRIDPAFRLTSAQIWEATFRLTQGINGERLHFESLLGDLPIDL